MCVDYACWQRSVGHREAGVGRRATEPSAGAPPPPPPPRPTGPTACHERRRDREEPDIGACVWTVRCVLELENAAVLEWENACVVDCMIATVDLDTRH